MKILIFSILNKYFIHKLSFKKLFPELFSFVLTFFKKFFTMIIKIGGELI